MNLHQTILATLRDYPGGLHPEALTWRVTPSVLPQDGREARGAVNRACLELALSRRLRRLPGGLFALPEGVAPPAPELPALATGWTLTAPEPKPPRTVQRVRPQPELPW